MGFNFKRIGNLGRREISVIVLNGAFHGCIALVMVISWKGVHNLVLRGVLNADEAAAFMAVSLFLFVAFVTISFVKYRQQERTRKAQYWLIDKVSWSIKRLIDHERFGLPGEGLGIEKEEEKKADRWPWGSHHTEYLGHLEAAARKWWILYDPTDPTTAPTNDMVSEWLQLERNLSREKARAIASMLRPDGLPTGPRR